MPDLSAMVLVESVTRYTRCPLCPGSHKCIAPSGPVDADVLFIGEAPGRNEEKQNQVFIGRTGDEVNNHYLPLAGLRRENVCVTNAIRCLPTSAGGKLDSKKRGDRALLDACAAHHLYPHIEGAKPKLLVPMGAFACAAVCPDISLDLHHGMPVETAWGIPAFPMYHPALGIYEPKKMLFIRTDWHRLRSYLAGKLKLAVDEYPEPDYQEITHADEIALDPDLPTGCDTESTRKKEPFCLTYSQQPGAAYLLRHGPLVADFGAALRACGGPVIFHNYLYDWTVVEAMGLELPYQRIVDTMATSFHLGNLPQGLKALAYRELGMEMQDFDDLVTPYSTQLVLDYYKMAADWEWPKPDEQLVVDDKTGKWKLYRPQGMNTKFKRFFTDFRKKADKDVFQTWENWEDQQAAIERVCGEWPGKCISHAPFEKVLHYACRDADATLRLYHIQQQMIKNVRKRNQELWRSA